MSEAVPVAFYAPLKSPDHPVASGDRTVARHLWSALEGAGFAPTLASRLRSLDLAGCEATQRAAHEAGLRDAEAFVAAAERGDPARRPRLWFTYHAYYKAPDHLGPRVAAALAIPYVVAEASRAAKRATGPWAFAHRAHEAGLDRADLVIAPTETDFAALAALKPAGQRLMLLPPFIDLRGWPPPSSRPPSGAARLLAVAMMRAGDKLASFRLLAEVLGGLVPRDWTLTIAGDGPARADVEALFAPFGSRVRFAGTVAERSDLAALYAGSDLLVWPAVNEAYGMALLEAGAMGCPVLAGRYGGVASVVTDGVTGVLAPPGDVGAFRTALAGLLDAPERRAGLGRTAAALIRRERGLEAAASRLDDALRPLLARAPA